ncbi:MAG: DUF5320 family protein [Verrucomicrobia bacterium]|nr:DUF5320 family protein [Verrucomicrobiota bacterium]
MTPMGDGTGPYGQGSGAGNRRGLRGEGQGRGRGGGRGWRRGAAAAEQTSEVPMPSTEPVAGGAGAVEPAWVEPAGADSERQQLSRQVDVLRSEVAALQERIRQLEAQAQKAPGAEGSASA